MNSTSPCEVKEDKRKYPRLVLQIPVKVHIEQGYYADAFLHDLSPDGLQIRCGQETAREIDTISKKTFLKTGLQFLLNLHCHGPTIIQRSLSNVRFAILLHYPQKRTRM